MINDLQIKTENGYKPLTGLTLIGTEPVYYDNKFMGERVTNIDGNLSINVEDNKELFEFMNKIIDETKLTDMCIEDSFGRKFKGQFYKEIENIHRVKKGKRYIIKFDYTGNECFRGILVVDNNG